MTAEILNLNAFFSYFFVIGDHLYIFFGGALMLGAFVGLLEILLHKE